MPAVDPQTGRLLLAEKGELSLSPDGHGGMLAALANEGLLREMRDRGVEYLYYHQVDNPTAKAEAFSDGWFRTGDIGRVDAEGRLVLDGRIKEMINRGGEKIAPAEIDAVLLSHPDVAQAVAFARPHARLGEEVAAAVVPAGELDMPGLRRFLGERLAAFKVPRTILVVDDIPKGPTGKLRRIGLAAQLGLVEDVDA